MSLNFSKSKRIPELDGIRGLAILLVLLYHYIAVLVPENAGPGLRLLQQMLSNGWSGVDLFFVLSGFLIAGILIDNRNASNYFQVFYIRRVNRIFPLYYSFLIGYILLEQFGPRLGWFSNHLFTNTFSIAPYFLHLQNFSMALKGTFGNEFLAVTWSLAIEEHFYLFLPLLIRKSQPNRLPLVFTFFIAFTLFLRALLGSGSYIGFVLTPWRLDALFIGALLAFIVRSEQILAWIRARIAWFKAAFAGLLIFIVFSTLTEELGSLDHLFVFGIFYCLLILLTLIETKGPLARSFRNPALINLGLVAYGLYLFHQLVNGLLHDIVFKSTPVFDSGATIAVTILAFALTYCLAQATYHVFEKRFIAFGHRFRYTPDSRVKTDDLLAQRESHSVVPRQTTATEAIPN